MADENKPFKQAKVYAGDTADQRAWHDAHYESGSTPRSNPKHYSGKEFTVTGSTSQEGGQTVDEALRDAESRESFLKKSAEDRDAEERRLRRKYQTDSAEEQALYDPLDNPEGYYRLSALSEVVRLVPEIVEHLPPDMVKDVKDFDAINVDPRPEGHGGSVYNEMTDIPGISHRSGLSPLEDQQRLLKQMKQDAGYNSLTSEMINKKNSGDK